MTVLNLRQTLESKYILVNERFECFFSFAMSFAIVAWRRLVTWMGQCDQCFLSRVARGRLAPDRLVHAVFLVFPVLSSLPFSFT